MESELYYVENIERGVVGNCLLWWKKNNNGYVCDLKEAKKFSQEEAFDLCNSSPRKYRPWKASEIEKIIQHHVDIQSLRHIAEIELKSFYE